MSPVRRLLAHLIAAFVLNKEKSDYVKNLVKYGVWKKHKERKRAQNIKKFKYDLAVVAIMKNEGSYLREWIEYHKMMGVDKFFLYDNESDDDTREILEPYIKSGLVEYIYFPGQKMQLPAYNDCLEKHKFDAKWLAVFDLDEFLVPVKYDNVKDYLKTLDDDVAQVLTNWVIFGSNGHETRPAGLVLESYTMCAKNNWSTKSIIKPYLAMVMGVHQHTVAGKTINPGIDVIRMHHYHCKSWQEYLLKSGRGDVFDGADAGMKKYQRGCFDHHDKNEVSDTTALKFVPELKRILSK